MIYECDECGAALPAGARACPKCGGTFEEAVPEDAVLPKRGFSPAPARNTPDFSDLLSAFGQEPDEPLSQSQSREEALEEAIRALNGQVIVLKSEVILLKSQVPLVKTEMAALSNEIIQLINRLSVVEMARREDRRRFTDHVEQVTEALQFLQHTMQRGTENERIAGPEGLLPEPMPQEDR